MRTTPPWPGGRGRARRGERNDQTRGGGLVLAAAAALVALMAAALANGPRFGGILGGLFGGVLLGTLLGWLLFVRRCMGGGRAGLLTGLRGGRDRGKANA